MCLKDKLSQVVEGGLWLLELIGYLCHSAS